MKNFGTLFFNHCPRIWCFFLSPLDSSTFLCAKIHVNFQLDCFSLGVRLLVCLFSIRYNLPFRCWWDFQCDAHVCGSVCVCAAMWAERSDQCVSQARNKLGWLERKTQLQEGARNGVYNANSNLKPIILPIFFILFLCVCDFLVYLIEFKPCLSSWHRRYSRSWFRISVVCNCVHGIWFATVVIMEAWFRSCWACEALS